MRRITPRARSKYGAIKENIDGIRFDSRAEATYYQFIKLEEAAGRVRMIERQPKVYMTEAKILIKPDFFLEEVATGKRYYVDVKGMRTAVFQIKRRLWKFYASHDLHIVKKTRGGFETVEIVLHA